jgi:CBS domain containing-hemolysin-like protein
MTAVCRLASGLAVAAAVASAPEVASASFLHGEALDTVANWIAIFILIALPIGGIVLFWMVHILPEKVAEKRHHPQKDAIKALCLLSLVFGGLLWPLAWLWAYSKPVLYKLAYGTDKHEEGTGGPAPRAAAEPGALADEVARIRHKLNALAARGALPAELEPTLARLATLEARVSTREGWKGA